MLVLSQANLWAQDTLTVGLKPTAPFVILDTEGRLSGFSVSLIRILARHVNPTAKLRFVMQDTIHEHLETIRQGKVDLAITATTITSEREKYIDFSYPFFTTSLAVLVPQQSSYGLIIQDLLDSDLPWVLFSFIVFILLSANLVWFAERGDSAFDDRWYPGFTQGLWWTVVTMSTVGYGDFAPRRPLGRILAGFVIIIGIMVFSYVVASLSSTLTMTKLNSTLESVEDLRRFRVGVVSASTGDKAMRGHNIVAFGYDNIDLALNALKNKEINALVYDSAILNYKKLKEPQPLPYELVNGLFPPEHYGITFPAGSPLRKQFNVPLLALINDPDSEYYQLMQKWFGHSNGP